MQLLTIWLQFKLRIQSPQCAASKALQFTVSSLFDTCTSRFRQSVQKHLEIGYTINDNIYQYLNKNSLKLTFTQMYCKTQFLHKKKLIRWAYLRSVFVNKTSQYHLQKVYYKKSFKLYFMHNTIFLEFIKLKWKSYLELLSINKYNIKITKN